jgi:hypothetical protein
MVAGTSVVVIALCASRLNFSARFDGAVSLAPLQVDSG